MSTGRVESVWFEYYGQTVEVDAPEGTQVVTIGFTADFDEDGGQLLHVESGVIYDYDSADPESETITLTSPLPVGVSWVVGDMLRVYPLADDMKANVRLDDAEDDDEPIEARVSHSVRAMLPEGVREPGLGESVRLEQLGYEWVVQDVVGVSPILDGTLLDPETVPPARDGVAPESSPTPTIQGGIGSLFVRWTGTANNDPVTYEVHLSISPGFTPDALSLAAETNGTMAVLRKLPDGTDLAYGATYYVQIIAKDLDGAAAPSVEASGQMVQVNTPDIAVGAITANEILANTITAEELGTIELTSSKIFAPTSNPSEWHLEIGDPTKPIVWRKDTQEGFSLSHDPETGTSNVFVSGRFQFGDCSQLENDYVELCEQQSSGFAVPQLRQRDLVSPSTATTSITFNWPTLTSKGNCLICYVITKASSGGLSPAYVSGMTGWTYGWVENGLTRLHFWYKSDAVAESGAKTITFDRACFRAGGLFEYDGLAVSAIDVGTNAVGNSTTVSTGTTAVTTQANELWFAVGGFNSNSTAMSMDLPTNGFTEVGDSSGFTVGGGSQFEVRVKSAQKNVTATGAANTTWGLPSAREWLGCVFTFKARAAGGDPPTPDMDRGRFYVKDVGGRTIPYYINNTGQKFALADLPYFHAVRSDALSIDDTSWTGIGVGLTGGDILVDNYNGAVSGVYQFPLTGIYEVGGSVPFVHNNSTGARGALLSLNGAGSANGITGSHAMILSPSTQGGIPVTPTIIRQFNAGDNVRINGWQNSGGLLALQTGGNALATLTVRCVRLL